jgi:hypothetical protein
MENYREKAISLINSFNLVILDTALGGSNQRVKKCAIIAVNEIIHSHYYDLDAQKYWEQIKKEIEKL